MDKYELGQSKIGSITELQQEVRLDIQLERNTHCNKVIIYGYVTDFCGKPIEDACISFINFNNTEIGYVYSNKEGFYIFDRVELNSIIRIIVKKEGYRISRSDFRLICLRRINYNISLKRICNNNDALVCGYVFNEKYDTLANISIYLLKKCDNNQKYLLKSTNSNIHGQFILAEIPKGNYELLINDSYYNVYTEEIEICKNDEIIDLKIFLHRIRRQNRNNRYFKHR